MASGGVQPPGPAGQRHSGVVHGGLNKRRASSPRRNWLAGGVVALVTVVAMILVANAFATRPTEVAVVPTPTAGQTPDSSLPIFVQETPNPTLPPTSTPSPTPTPLPTLIPTFPPTPPPTASPAPTASP